MPTVVQHLRQDLLYAHHAATVNPIEALCTE